MLSPEYLAQLPEPLVKLWELVEDDILRDIGRRIRKMDVLTDTAAYQAFRLEQTKLLHTDIVKLIAKYSGKSETVLRKMLQQAAIKTLRSEDVIHAAAGVILPPINQSENLLNLLNAGYRQTVGTWKNLTATTANTVTRQFEDALDRSWLQVSSGAFDYQTAIRRAVDDLAQHMDGVTYPSGHHDSLEVAVRRATLTGVNQTCGKLQWERREQAGCEFVEVSAHSGAREYDGGGPKDHAGWQGKVYHVGGAIDYEGEHYEDFVTATGYGTGDGLCGWNCRHNYCSFWPGISTRVYTDEQLADLSAKNIEYNGKMYSRYEINQMQREKERNVRKWKKTWMIEKEAGLDTTSAAIRLRNARKSLNDFVKATGGRVNSSRLSTWNTSTLPGKRFSHSEATSATWDARKAATVTQAKAEKIAPPGNKILKNETTPADSTDTSTAAIAQAAVPQRYHDITGNWYPDATPNSHTVEDLQSITVDGVTYQVDGHNVELSYSPHEKEIAELLEREIGGELYMVPRVNNPQGVSTPDYMFHGAGYDLKTISKDSGPNAIYNRVKKAKRQSQNFIVDITQIQPDDALIKNQIEKIFRMKETSFVNEIVIINNGKIVRVAKRA